MATSTPDTNAATDTPQPGESCSRVSVVLSALWGVAVCLLLTGLMAYSQIPGALAKPNAATAETIPLATDRHTLLLAFHPKCACTAASIYELERLIAKHDSELLVHILVYRPDEFDSSWENSNPIGPVADLDIVSWEWDVDGSAAESHGCLTSGSVVLYDSSGQAKFWGGITQSRAHAGDNIGIDTIVEILTTGSSQRTSTPVYGCSMRTPLDDAPRSRGEQ